jgi:complement component 1 Q subcomponent-binding protein, mitochondrial
MVIKLTAGRIKVEFSINDLLGLDEDEMDASEDDSALSDEPFDRNTINQSGNKVDVMPEDSIAPADRGEDGVDGEDQVASPAYELNFDVTITKPDGKAIFISCATSDGSITIENVMNGVPEPTSTGDKYTGPQMSHIDPDLLAMLDVYLEERGVDASLASFALNYNDFKEQREYVDWLKSKQNPVCLHFSHAYYRTELKDFVDA